MTNTGIMYMAFGEQAKGAVSKSIASIKRLNLHIPIVLVGDVQINDIPQITWSGIQPRDKDGDLGFLAGRVKPHLYHLSPFQKTLYLDADTLVKKDIVAGFDFLDDADICVSYHVKPNGDIWYVDEIFSDPLLSPPISPNSVKEREITQRMIGDQRMPFINSGVIFFRTANNVQHFFETWYEEWQVFSDWDEQMSWHRTMCRCPDVKVKLLDPIWNQKYESRDTVILHYMGKKKARGQ
jgi:hypothetical protein